MMLLLYQVVGSVYLQGVKFSDQISITYLSLFIQLSQNVTYVMKMQRMRDETIEVEIENTAN